MNLASNTTQCYTEELLKVLRYFDFFNYPLSKTQLLSYLSIRIDNIQHIDQALGILVVEKKIEEKNGFYALNNIDLLLSNRIEGEKRFEKFSQRIEKTSRRLSRFPFIHFVGLSGSLSKGYAPEKADIDLFIITQKNRLWICRSVLHFFKKLSFLKGSQHWYCMNYFVDETAMEIEEQNYFTAIELSTLKPLIDKSNFHQQLIESNKNWLSKTLPNYLFNQSRDTKKSSVLWALKIFEIFGTNTLNTFLMNWTDKKWKRKWAKKNYPAEDYEIAFKTKINISKNHEKNYQKKVLNYLHNTLKT